VINLSLLAVFKYADFAIGTLNAVLPTGAFALPGLALPLGISFFTFHSISYLVDVHRGDVVANPRPLEVAVYIAMFPQLVAGPIIRYHTISGQLASRRLTFGRASAGMRIFIIGIAQKVLIADEVARIAETIFDKVGQRACLKRGLGSAPTRSRSISILPATPIWRFGLGLALGFAFPRNFRLPYTASSITDSGAVAHQACRSGCADYLYVPWAGAAGRRRKPTEIFGFVFCSVGCGMARIGRSWSGARITAAFSSSSAPASRACSTARRHWPRDFTRFSP